MALRKKAAKANQSAGDKHFNLLLLPMITEKAAQSSSSRNQILFRVPKTATKDQIKNAVQKVFKVEVERVNTLNIMGKPKRTTGRMGSRSDLKKAYVKLKEGQTIDVIEGL